MNTTAIFVELLLIGFGAACWLVLFLAGIVSARLDAHSFEFTAPVVSVVVGVAYVLGIVVDRLMRGLFAGPIQRWAARRVFNDDNVRSILKSAPRVEGRDFSMKLEKYIRARSEALGNKIDYNRSRLRICRAWVVHFLLIALGVLFWNERTHAIPWRTAGALAVVAAACFALTLAATLLLARDCCVDLIESFEILEQTKQATEGEQHSS